MGSRRFGRRFRPAGLDDDDRFTERHFAGGREERRCLTHRLHVDHDGARMGIVAQVVDQIAPSNVQHRADGDKSAETHLFSKAPIQNGGAQGAALADEGDIPRTGNGRRERGVEPRYRAHDAEAIWSDQAHARAASLGKDLLLQLRAVRARFAEPRRNDDRALNTGRPALTNDPGHRCRGRGDYGQCNGLGKRRQRGIRPDSQNAGPGGIDRINRAAERAANQIPENGAADRAGCFGRSDNRYRFRSEEEVEVSRTEMFAMRQPIRLPQDKATAG